MEDTQYVGDEGSGCSWSPGRPLVGVDESVGSWLPQVGSRSSGRVGIIRRGWRGAALASWETSGACLLKPEHLIPR